MTPGRKLLESNAARTTVSAHIVRLRDPGTAHDWAKGATEETAMSELSGGQRFIRQVNDSIYELLERLGSEDGDFWCECSHIDCDERVLLTLREYAATRQRDNEILLSGTHEQQSAAPAG